MLHTKLCEVLATIPEEDHINLYNGKKQGKNLKIWNEFWESDINTLFPKLLRTFNCFDYSLWVVNFKTQINFNINYGLKTFLDKFPKYDVKHSFKNNFSISIKLEILSKTWMEIPENLKEQFS